VAPLLSIRLRVTIMMSYRVPGRLTAGHLRSRPVTRTRTLIEPVGHGHGAYRSTLRHWQAAQFYLSLRLGST
jgi:hypothetical protein